MSESAPAIGATTIGIAVHGRTRRPASSGEYPCAVWKNCVSRKIEPNIPNDIASDAPFAAEKPRLRKKRIGSIGCGVRSSHRTNATSSATPAASDATIDALAQPSALPFTRPQTMPSRPAAREREAGQVERLVRPVALAQARDRERHEQQSRPAR